MKFLLLLSIDTMTSSLSLSLLNMKTDMWGDQVTVVSCDMRQFHPEEKADIIVSELLGSFGDNELSPECLDGAQTFLKGSSTSGPLPVDIDAV